MTGSSPWIEGERRGWRAYCEIEPIASTDPAISWCEATIAEQGVEELVEALNANNQALHAAKDAEEGARARLSSLLGAAPVVVYSFRASGDFAPTFVSDSIQGMLGYRPDEYLENADFWRSCVHPDDLAGVEAEQAQLFRTGQHLAEYRFRKKNGNYCWVSDEQHLTRDTEGQPLEVVGSWSDIDIRKAAEQAIQAAQAELEKANEAKSAFLANMSHEIRTPMNAVLGLSHLALKTDPSPRLRDYLVKIRSSGQHLLGIINEILDFSKIEAGKLAVESIEFDLDKVLENVSNLIAEKASDKGLELIFDIEPSVVSTRLKGDPLRLGQILINFCNNAVKFTDKGEVIIRAHVLDAVEDGLVVKFSVSDTGIGMTAGANRASFPSVRASRYIDNAQIWRHRAWAGHLQTSSGVDGWRRWGDERAGQRKYILVHRSPRERGCGAAAEFAPIRPARPPRPDHRRQLIRSRGVVKHAAQHDVRRGRGRLRRGRHRDGSPIG